MYGKELIEKCYRKCRLRSDSEIQSIIDNPGQAPILESLLSMAFELAERRKIHGPLGPNWLAKPQERNRDADQRSMER